MTRLIDLGKASEETKGAAFNSTQIDSIGQKMQEGGVYYCSAPPSIADDVRQESDG